MIYEPDVLILGFGLLVVFWVCDKLANWLDQ